MSLSWKPWAERWVSAYLAITAVPLILGPGADLATMKQGLLQFVVAALVLMVSRWCHRQPHFAWLSWGMWLPLMPWVYGTMDLIQKSLKRPIFDTLVQNWERQLFGFSPALRWCQEWPWRSFSELMHAFYFAYYLVLPLLIVRLLRQGLGTRARLALAGGIASLVVCYCLEILFPVQGPRPLQPPLPEGLRGPFWALTHYISDKGACAAAAFPSGHVALTMAVFVMAWRWDRKLWPFYALCVIGIWAGTVYGRFHYAIDGLAGILVGAVAGAMALRALENMSEEDMPT